MTIPGTVISLWNGPIRIRRSMPEMVYEVADLYSVSVQEIRGPGRIKDLVIARDHFMWLAHQQPHLSLTKIGHFLSNRDHSTIWAGIKRHVRRQSLDDAA